MANFTGANVIVASDVTKYQPDAFGFGIASGDTEATNFFAQTTNDILRQLRIEWWPVYKTNVFTDITVLNTAEMVDTKVNLDQFERAGVYLFLGRFLEADSLLLLLERKVDCSIFSFFLISGEFFSSEMLFAVFSFSIFSSFFIVSDLFPQKYRQDLKTLLLYTKSYHEFFSLD